MSIATDYFNKASLKQYLMVLLGTFIVSAAYMLFISPYKFMPGGVYGISIMVHHLTKGTFEMFPDGFPIGTLALLIDIPLTIIGTKILGPRFGFKTVLGFVSMSVFTSVLEYFWGYEPLVQGEPLLSAIFGGVLVGIGAGLVFKAHATTGGSDIIAAILAKYTRGPLGMMQIYVDSAIVLLALAAFHDWSIPLFSWIIIFIAGKCTDVVLQGLTVEKALIIITDRPEEIREVILNKMDRGGTFFNGRGMYHNQERNILFTVLSRRQAELLKDFIREIDPKAFMAVLDASEVLGEGFKELKVEN
ncbi:MAG: YitT family protein [Bacteroidales bacterium]|nr:YitT family protein [Bacteroidales bacterium]